MKRTMALIIAMVFIFAIASVSLAAEKKATVTGEITAVDAAGKTITVKGPKKGDVVIGVDDKTLGTAKVGDKVKVTYTTGADGKNTAKSVQPVKKKEETKKAEPTKPTEPAKPAEPKKAPGY